MLDAMTMAGLVLLGFIVSLLVGLTSVGSGALMTPILYLDYSSILSHAVAVGTSSTQGSAVKAIGSLRNYLIKSLNTAYAFTIAITGVPFAIMGALLTRTATSYAIFQLFLGAVLLIAAAGIIAQAVLTKKLQARKSDPKVDGKFRIKGAIIGAYVGVIAGATGVSTGSLAIASILLLLELKPHTAVDVAIFEGFIILLAATIVQLYLGNVNLIVTGLLVLGGIPGILAGSSLKGRFNATTLTYLIAAVIVFESLRIMLNYYLPGRFLIF